jgi:hypothetical protein
VEVQAVNEQTPIDTKRHQISRDQSVPKETGPQVVDYKMPTAKQLRKQKFPERTFLLAPWLREHESCLMYAASGVGKSLFAMSAAIAIAGGGDFLGWRPQARANGKPWRVLYVDGEMHIADIQVRLEMLLDAMPGVDRDAADAGLRLFSRQHQTDGSLFPLITTAAGMEYYEARAAHVDLIIFDNLSTLGEVEDENSAASFNAVTEFLLRLKAKGVATMLVHHANKTGENYRGSSKLAATFETIIKLERVEDDALSDDARFKVVWEKKRAGGRDLRPVSARLKSDPEFGDETPADATGGGTSREPRRCWEYVSDELADFDRLKEMLVDGAFTSQKEIADWSGISQQAVSKRIQKGVDLGLWTDRKISEALALGKDKRRRGATKPPLRVTDWRSEDPAGDGVVNNDF